MNKNLTAFIAVISSIIVAFVFAVWSYCERVETVNYFIASEIVILLVTSLLLVFYYQYKRDNLVLLILYILLLEACELSALNFKNIPFADILFNVLAVLLFAINLVLKIILLSLLVVKVTRARKELSAPN